MFSCSVSLRRNIVILLCWSGDSRTSGHQLLIIFMVALADGATRKMEVEDISNLELKAIMDYLINNPDVEFSSQQRGENDLTREEKRSIATQLLNANKNLFLVKFGKYLNANQLNCFGEFCNDTDRGIQLKCTLDRLQLDKRKMTKQRRNRRYQALQEMIFAESYFSEPEMMKRNPLLYNELVGQYLTEDERRARDKASEQETLVQILMEGIERDDARELRKKQAEMEDNAMEEEDTSDEDEEHTHHVNRTDNTRKPYARDKSESPEPEAGHSRWGECAELADDRINHDEFYARSRTVEIAPKQKALLRKEFTSLMHQSFLDGNDDFDYETVDNNESYDNLEIITQDEEDKYFDSEEPNGGVNTNSGASSEDELEIFMNQLQTIQPAVGQLSNAFEKL